MKWRPKRPHAPRSIQKKVHIATAKKVRSPAARQNEGDHSVHQNQPKKWSSTHENAVKQLLYWFKHFHCSQCYWDRWPKMHCFFLNQFQPKKPCNLVQYPKALWKWASGNSVSAFSALTGPSSVFWSSHVFASSCFAVGVFMFSHFRMQAESFSSFSDEMEPEEADNKGGSEQDELEMDEFRIPPNPNAPFLAQDPSTGRMFLADPLLGKMLRIKPGDWELKKEVGPAGVRYILYSKDVKPSYVHLMMRTSKVVDLTQLALRNIGHSLSVFWITAWLVSKCQNIDNDQCTQLASVSF